MHLPRPSPEGESRKKLRAEITEHFSKSLEILHDGPQQITPYHQGYLDAQRGHTACPYGVKSWAEGWAQGYDEAVRAGEAKFPRYGALKKAKR
jgi:hypothetical protein